MSINISLVATGDIVTISLSDLWWEKGGARIISGTETVNCEYGYIEADYNEDPDLANGDGYFDFYDEDGVLCCMDGETCEVIGLSPNSDGWEVATVTLKNTNGEYDTEFKFTAEEFEACAYEN